MSQNIQLSRRTVLRGLGTAIALPLLDAMVPFGQVARAAATQAAGAAPRRMACIFVPNGIHMPDWTPASVGFNFELPYVLQPLARVKNDLLVLSGLTHDKGRANGDGPGDHARSASVFLTGAQPRKTDGENIRSGISVDQAAAEVVGKQTRFPSLQLGCEQGRSAGECDSGYSCAYSSNISWASGAQPLAKETNPRLVFERLFAGTSPRDAREGRGRRDALQQSILDFVADDARRIQTQLGRTDQQKLDEYMTGIREIERRLEYTERSSAVLQKYRGLEAPEGIPDHYGDHLRLMCDMMVLAFQADLTRVVSCMFANAGSNRNYQDIGVPDGHHNLSHHGGDPKKHAKIREINRFHVQQLAYLLERLKAIPEGDGTLLDNCMVLYGSGLSDGNRHNHHDLPVLVAGRGGGTLRTGRHLRFDQETPMNNLFLSMLDRMDAPLDFIGDSTGRLPYLA